LISLADILKKGVNVKPKYGITSKLFVWFFITLLIFYGTILVLYINFQEIVRLSEDIVTKNNKISSLSKKMIENLLYMEENDKKYHLLKKEDYLGYFISAQKEFEINLIAIIQLESMGMAVSWQWKQLYENYKNFSTTLGNLKDKPAEPLWIPEPIINEWLQKISVARLENEQNITSAIRELNRRGQISARNGLIGLGISSLVGLVGIMFLAYSMIRPLRELSAGIKSISQERYSEPIVVRSKDEFGQLAGAFNEMAVRLKEEERMRSDFISMLSHEIRTPLTSIRESVNMIVEEIMGGINQRQRKFLKIASVEIGRICELLNHFMQVSRLESGAVELKLKPIETAPFVSRCVYQLNPAAEAKNINIEMQISPGLPNLTGDPEQLQRVFLNLLDNAIKFSPHGSKVTVCSRLDDDPENLRFSVSDNGPGIPKEEQSLIFNKYYQSRGARDHMSGVGLGLNITKRIVQAHSGNVWVNSKVGKGSTFFFTLPVACEELKSRLD
jgi:signal transduction histidine kinase